MEITTELMNKIKNADSPEEILKIAKENDADITLDNAKMILTTIQQSKTTEKKPKRSAIKKMKSDN